MIGIPFLSRNTHTAACLQGLQYAGVNSPIANKDRKLGSFFPLLFALTLAFGMMGSTWGQTSPQTWVGGTLDDQQTFTVPAGVNRISIRCWGGGGGSGSITTTLAGGAQNRGAGGGGGGAFSYAEVSVTPGEVLYIQAGKRGAAGPATSNSAGGNGGQSWVRRTSQSGTILCGADNGNGGGGGSGGAGGNGGSTSSGVAVGDIKNAGGNGSAGSTSNGTGGGGGGSGGYGGNGQNGTIGFGGAGGAPGTLFISGYAGASVLKGTASTSNSNNGVSPLGGTSVYGAGAAGAARGGSNGSNNGDLGAPGAVQIRWSCPTSPNAGLDATICSGGSTQLSGTATAATNCYSASSGTLYSYGFPSSGGTWTRNNTTYVLLSNTTTSAGGTSPELSFATSTTNPTTLELIATSPDINASGWNNLSLSFRRFLNYYAGTAPDVVLETSTDNTNWTIRWRTNPTADVAAGQVTGINLSMLDRQTFKIRFRVVSGNIYNYDHYRFDDILITGVQSTNCSVGYSWSPSGGLSNTAIANPIANPTGTTTYTMAASTAGCSVTDDVIVNVNTPSVAPTSLSASATTICNGGSATLTQTGGSLGTGASWQWYSDANFTTTVGGTLSSSNASLSVSPTTTTTYYLRAINGTSPCAASIPASTPSTVSATVNVVNQPSAGTVTSDPATGPFCAGTIVTASVSGGSGGTGTVIDVIEYDNGAGWFTYSSGVAASTGTIQFRTYRTASGNGCSQSSTNTATALTVIPCPVITPSGSLSAFAACTTIPSSQQSFTVSGVDLTEDIVVSAPAGFQVSLTTNNNDFGASVSIPFGTGTVSNVTVYVRMLSASTPAAANITLSSSGAVTQNVAVSGTVNQNLSAVTISGTNNQSICSNGSGTQLTASETNGGTITSRQWGYRTTSGGSITDISGATGSSYTPAGSDLPAGVSYIVCTSTPTCGSPVVSNEITVTETVLPSASISYTGSPYCPSVTSVSPNFTGTSGGTYSSTAGLTITAAGEINPSTSTAGTYTVTYTIAASGGCAQVTANTSITVSPNMTAGAASSTPSLCISTPLTTITHATANATGIGTPSGLPNGVTASWSTNTITITGTPTQSGLFSYSIPLTGGCGTANATGSITVNAQNTISLTSAVGTDAQTSCANSAITGITYATTGATGATLSGNPAGVTGSWNSNVYTISGSPSATGTFNYTVTMTGGCTGGTNTASGSITVNAQPTVTFTAQPGATACTNADVTYTTQSGQSNYVWTVPGTLNTDYSITSGGTSSSNTVTLKWLTTGSKTVTVNYSNASGCSATAATSSTATTVLASPTVNAGADFNMCSGQTVQMSGSTNATPTNGSQSSTYSAGNAIVMYSPTTPTTSVTSTCPIPLSVTIPLGATITGVNVTYGIVAQNAAWRSEQKSYLKCVSPGGISESTISSGTQNSGGSATLSRSNLTIANGVIGGGTINFELHAFQIYTGSGCATTYGYISNNTFTITVNYSFTNVSWSPSTGLSSTTILNPSCSATNSATYTLTSTSGNGCSASDQVVVTVSGSAPSAPTASAGSAEINVGGTNTLTSSAGANTLWYETASAVTSVGSGDNWETPVQCTSGIKTYYAEDFNGTCASATRTPVSFTVRSMVAENPSNGLICSAGGSVTLSAQLTGGSSITWSPNTNLSTTSGSSTIASPTATTIYTMNATVTGCGAVSETATVGVIEGVSFSPSCTNCTGSPVLQVCAGGAASLASNLASSGFSSSTTTYSYSSPSSPTLLINNGSAVAANPYTSTNTLYPLFDDAGWSNIPIGFSYNFFGSNYSTVNVGTNGIIHFGTYSSSIINDFSFTTLPSASEPLNIIAVAANDNDMTGSGNGTLRYWTEGIAPTRVFIVEWSGASQQFYTSNKTTAQVKLFETTGIVEVHVNSSNSTNTKVVGLQNNANPPVGALATATTSAITGQAWKFIPGANYSFQWSTAGTPINLATGDTYTTPALNSPGTITYSVAATNPNTQCTATRTVDVTVNALPAAPVSTGDVTACNTAGAQLLTVNVGTGVTADWYNAPTAGTLLANNTNSYSTATAGTYYAEAQDLATNCVSATRTPVTLNLNPAPTPPTTSPVAYCQGEPSVALTASAPSGSNTQGWYTAPAGGTASGPPTPSTATPGSNTYYVSEVSASNGCESTRTPLTVTVNATPAAPAASNPAPYCQGATASALTATAAPGSSLYWYTVPTGGTGTTTAPVPSTATPGTTDYYVANRDNTSSCEGPRTTVTVTVIPNITASVTNSASSTSVCGGGSITFTATPTNGGTPSYQWYLNGSPVGGETNPTYTLAGPANNDQIYVEMTPSAQTCLTSSAATASNTVTLTSSAETPIVAIQSSATSAICPGTSVTFSVNASSNMGSGPIYQWNLNGSPVSGETNPTFTTTTLANGDQVTLTMTSSLPAVCVTSSSATSSAITTTVNAATMINTQPVATSACLGSSANFTVSATGQGTLTYQWMKDGVNITGNATAVTNSLTLSGITAGSAANYSVMVTGGCNTLTSNAVPLTIKTATAISDQPDAVAQCAGTTANFEVIATGQGTISYQWRKDGSPLSGETNSTLSIVNIGTANAGQYSVLVSAECGSVTSSNALLTVNPLTTITSQPAAVTLCANNTANFSVTAIGSGTLSYQWKKGGSNVGTNSNLLSISNAQAIDAAVYTVVVSSSVCNQVTSNNALLTVNPLTSIVTQPTASPACQGQPTTFTVVAAGTSPLTYSWNFGGAAIPNTNSNTFTISNTTTANDGSYSVTVGGGCGTVNSSALILTVNPTPSLSSSLTPPAICSGSTFSYTATSATTGATFSWSRAAVAGISQTAASGTGNVSETLTNTTTAPINVTYVYTTAANSCSNPGQNVIVTVNPTPSLSSSLTPPAICTGSSFSYTATSATTGATFTWSRATVAGITQTATSGSGNVSETLTNTTTAPINVTYVYTTTANSCSNSGQNVIVTVTAPPNAGTLSGTQAICVSGTTTFTSNGNSGGTWSSSDAAVATVNSSTGVVTGMAAGTATITYTVTGTGGCSDATATRTVTVNICSNTWTGNTNTNWDESGNWTTGVPTSNQDITIPVGRPNYPSLEVNPSVDDLTVQAGATLTIPIGQYITVSGILTNNGTVTVQDGGALVQGVGSTLSGTGTYSVKRNLPTADRFHYIGSPVNNVGVSAFGIVPSVFNGSNGSQMIPQSTCNPAALETGSPWANLLELREDAAVLSNCSQSLWHVKSAGTLENARGYAAMAYGTSTQNLSFDGTVNNGTVTYTGLGNSGPVPPAPPALLDPFNGGTLIYRGWHMVSNPYPSPVTFGANNGTLTGMGFDAQVQVWNSALNTWVPSVSNAVLPVAQGFQIRNSGGTALTFTATNAMRTPTSATFYDMPWEQYLTVTLENNAHTMQTVIFFHGDATDGYDGQLEANRLFGGTEVPVIYTLAANGMEHMAFNGYAPLYNETKTVPMGVYDGGTPGNFSLRFQDLNTLVNTTVVLEDTKLNTFTPVNEGDVYTFNTEADDEANRFRVHFNMLDDTQIGTQTQSLFSVFPNPAEDMIQVAFGDASQEYTLQLRDLSGKTLLNREVSAGTQNIQVSTVTFASGVYLLEVRSSSGERSVMKIIRK